jgi:hypothetical protein
MDKTLIFGPFFEIIRVLAILVVSRYPNTSGKRILPKERDNVGRDAIAQW